MMCDAQSCPSGVAHTYMAAEALKVAGKKAGVEVKAVCVGVRVDFVLSSSRGILK